MLNPIQRQNRIAILEKLPVNLKKAVNGLNDEQLNTPAREGGWTLRQIVHHLADAHMNGIIRMKLLLTESYPTLKTYDQDEWAGLIDSSLLPIRHSVAILEGLHARWTVLLKNLSETQWQRKAYHPENGDITLEDLLVTYAGHCENHLEQINQLRISRKW